VPGVRVADDLVERNFVPAVPNRLWCADIKYVRTWQGWLYLAAVMDCYSRRIVGWSMRPDLEAELVVDALEMAVTTTSRRSQPSQAPLNARSLIGVMDQPGLRTASSSSLFIFSYSTGDR
jgi:transposase InsO family protein